MVDVVNFALTVAQFDQNLDHRKNVLVAQGHLARGLFPADTTVEFHPTYARQVVGIFAVKEAVKKGFDRVFRGRFARSHHPVDRDLRGVLVGRFIDPKRARDVRPMIEIIGVEGRKILNARSAQLLERIEGDFLIGHRNDFARLGVGHLTRDRTSEQIVIGHGNRIEAANGHLADVLGIDPLVPGHDQGAVGRGDIKAGDLAFETLGNQLQSGPFVHQPQVVELKEMREDGFGIQADRFQQNRHRHLAPTVNAEVQNVLGVKLEIQPRAAVGDDPGRKQQLARTMGLATVMLKEHAR